MVRRRPLRRHRSSETRVASRCTGPGEMEGVHLQWEEGAKVRERSGRITAKETLWINLNFKVKVKVRLFFKEQF